MATAQGATVEHTFTDGFSLIAEWNAVDGDILTYVNAFATGNTSLSAPQPGGPQTTPALIVGVLQMNITTGEVRYTGTAETQVFTLSIADDLSSAQLQVTDWISSLGTRYALDINLSLTGTGDLAEQDFREHFSEPGFVLNYHMRGVQRDAVATGSVMVGGVNLTPGPSDTAHIMYARTGSVTVQAK